MSGIKKLVKREEKAKLKTNKTDKLVDREI